MEGSIIVHTLELIQDIRDEEKIRSILSAFSFPVSKIQRLFSSNHSVALISHKLSKTHEGLGMKKITVIRHSDTLQIGTIFYIILRIEPQMLLTHDSTTELFHCSDENKRQLADEFHTAMNHFVDDISFPELVELRNWNCRRLDYSVNLQLENKEMAELFTKISKRTSKHVRRNDKRLPYACKDQSAAEGNKSSKVLAYDKRKQIEKEYEGVPQATMQRLLEEAEGVVRFELQMKKQKLQDIMRKECLESRNIMNFLNEDLSRRYLLKCYLEMIGSGDFYSLYHASKIINESGYGQKKKENLIHLLQGIAQARSVQNAERQFINNGIHIKKTDIVVSGSKGTFYNRLKALEELGINPVLIMKDSKVKHIRNPINQI